MTESLTDAHAEVYKPGNEDADAPDLFVPGEAIRGANFSDRINRRKDSGKLIFHNDAGEYSTGDTRVSSGDLIRLYVVMRNDPYHFPDPAEGAEDPTSAPFGEGGFGGRRLRWAALVRDIELDYLGPNTSDMVLSCEDFTFGVMSMRRAYNAYEDTKIAGTSEAILNELLRHNAPEIDRGKIRDMTATTSATFDGTNLLEAAIALTRRSNAVMRSQDTALVFRSIEDMAGTPRLTVDGEDIGWFTAKFSDASMANRVRVDGGRDFAVDDEQLTQDGYQTVTQSSRLAFRVNTRKSNINRLAVHVNPTGSEEAVNVRLQKDDGTGNAPVAIADETSDIDNAQLDHHFLANDDLTTFIFGRDHTLPEPNPWVILETDGDQGQDIGVDTATTTPTGDNLPSYRAWYEYRITIRQSERESIDEYRLRETRISKDNLETLTEALHAAQEKINHDSVPDQTADFPAEALELHEVKAGDVLSLNFPRERTVGDYIVIERSDEYDGMRMDTELTVQEVDSV